MSARTVPKFRRWFFGYNRAEVEAALRRLSAEQMEKMSEADAKVMKVSAEAQRLQSETAVLSGELDSLKAREFAVSLAAKASISSAAAIVENSRQRAASLIRAVEPEINIHKAQIEQITAEIMSLKAAFSGATDEIRRITDKGYEFPSIKETEQAPSKVALQILPGDRRSQAILQDATEGLSRVEINTAGRKLVSQSNIPIGEVTKLILDRKNGEVAGYEIGTSAHGAIPDGTFIPASAIVAVRKDALVVGSEYLAKVGMTASLESFVRPQPEPAEARVDQITTALKHLLDAIPGIDTSQPAGQQRVDDAVESLASQIRDAGTARKAESEPARPQPKLAASGLRIVEFPKAAPERGHSSVAAAAVGGPQSTVPPRIVEQTQEQRPLARPQYIEKTHEVAQAQAPAAQATAAQSTLVRPSVAQMDMAQAPASQVIAVHLPAMPPSPVFVPDAPPVEARSAQRQAVDISPVIITPLPRPEAAAPVARAGVPATTQMAAPAPATTETRIVVPASPATTVPGPAAPRESAGVIEARIARSQMSYVVGKLAGRDLIGQSGQMIVAARQEITPAVVERAKADGRLAELIVYMVIPGLDEVSPSSS